MGHGQRHRARVPQLKVRPRPGKESGRGLSSLLGGVLGDYQPGREKGGSRGVSAKGEKTPTSGTYHNITGMGTTSRKKFMTSRTAALQPSCAVASPARGSRTNRSSFPPVEPPLRPPNRSRRVCGALGNRDPHLRGSRDTVGSAAARTGSTVRRVGTIHRPSSSCTAPMRMRIDTSRRSTGASGT